MIENLRIFYSQIIIRCKSTFNSVTYNIKTYVKQALIDLDAGELAVEDEAPATPSNAN